jgi:glucose-1-phosphate cytidylyltransferase
MKVVIFCGGKGTRISEYTQEIPKPLVEIGSKPILWHIMKYYSTFGHNDFILCLGHKGNKIKQYFSNNTEFKVQCIDTGRESLKSERLKYIKHLIDTDTFFVAYGDDVSNVDLNKLLNFHNQSDCIATLTTIQPNSQFGILITDENHLVTEFKEKPKLEHWINAGFFIFNKKIFDYMPEGEELERGVFELLAKDRKLSAYKHKGFWRCMNTVKDMVLLNKIWDENNAKWKNW